jgi:predicted phosphodiesterase
MPNRFIAIGDIHGCAHEFERLIEKLAPDSSDQILLLGDLINKGPDPLRVFDIARRIGAQSLLGNHELRLKLYRRTRDLSLLKKEDYPTLNALRGADWEFIEAMPLTHHHKETDTLFVHGGFLPRRPWQDQPAEVVTRIQVVDKQGRPRKRNECEDGTVWADLWEGPSFVVYGHTPREEVYKTKNSVCIDTGCVYGGRLTAFIAQDRSLVQVRARQSYAAD